MSPVFGEKSEYVAYGFLNFHSLFIFTGQECVLAQLVLQLFKQNQ
jgi:hypothetical protein